MENNTKANVVEMAKKKRHISLLEKMQKGKALTKAEIRELAEFEKGAKKPNIVNTKKEVANSFDISIRTVSNWIQDGMPVRKDGHYDLLEIKNWKLMREQRNTLKRREKKKKNRSENEGTNGQSEKDLDAKNVDWTWKKEEYDARLKKLKYEEQEGKLISREDAVNALKESIRTIKKQFLSLPKQIAPQLVGLEIGDIDQVLTVRIKEIIEGFARGKFK